MESNPQPDFDFEHPLYLELSKGYIFRLIELFSGRPDQDIVIRLSIHELEHAYDYEAISYVWGKKETNKNRLKQISCNGRTLHITANLDAVFRRIRLQDRSRIVWADAICINQENSNEKSHHVAFMSKVYKQAKGVLVCMGPNSDGGAENVAALVSEHVERMSRYTSITKMPVLPSNDLVFEDPRWKSLATLMGCPWFSRAWVIQEVGVATSEPLVLYGAAEFSYRDLMKLSRWIVRCASRLQQLAGINLLTIHTDWEHWTEDWENDPHFKEFKYTLLDFLCHAKGLGCREAHDHIYAFLGHPLAQKEDGSGPILTVDYKKPIAVVYQELTTWMLSKYGLGVLSAVEHDGNTINEELASWVVRWETELVCNSMGYYSNFYYDASASRNLTKTVVAAGNTLTVTAAFIDTVLKTYQFSPDEKDWAVAEAEPALRSATQLLAILARIWLDINNPEIPFRYSPSPRTDPLSLSLGAGLRNYEPADADPATYRANFAAFWALRQRILRGEQAPAEPDSGDADAFWFDMYLSCQGRSFFVTERGYYGLGPWIMRAGDRCCVFDGARVPFVVRGDGGEEGRVRLVGEAYVHGVMRGEVIGGADVVWRELTIE